MFPIEFTYPSSKKFRSCSLFEIMQQMETPREKKKLSPKQMWLIRISKFIRTLYTSLSLAYLIQLIPKCDWVFICFKCVFLTIINGEQGHLIYLLYTTYTAVTVQVESCINETSEESCLVTHVNSAFCDISSKSYYTSTVSSLWATCT